jgi:hypothetical protein
MLTRRFDRPWFRALCALLVSIALLAGHINADPWIVG